MVLDDAPLRRGLWRNLRSGLRVAFLLGAGNAGFVATWTQFALLFALSLLSTLFWQVADVGLRGEFHASALPGAMSRPTGAGNSRAGRVPLNGLPIEIVCTTRASEPSSCTK